MQDIVFFFWSRWHRGVQMGRKFEWQATEWVDAYKSTLSKNKLSEFNKEWDKLEAKLAAFRDGVKGAQPTIKF